MEYVLIVTTLTLGVAGTLWKNPPRRIQIAIIALLVLSGGVTALKTLSDENDKQLLQTLAISALVVPNGGYDRIYTGLEASLKPQGYERGTCHHTSDGMTCFLASDSGESEITAVLNKFELAQLYADDVRGKEIAAKINAILSQRYSPSALKEEFKDKLGILGTDIFFDMCARFPEGYDYDNEFGVTIPYEENGVGKAIKLSSEEILAVQEGRQVDVFYSFEQLYRTKIREAQIKGCDHAAPARIASKPK